jgi:hypothetical protein
MIVLWDLFPGRFPAVAVETRADVPKLAEFEKLGLVRALRRTADGAVTEYELTHLGRVLLERANNG